jgi:hypothetical protein
VSVDDLYGHGGALMGEPVACPAGRKVGAECLTAWTSDCGRSRISWTPLIEEGRDLSSMSGILAGSAYRLPLV